MQKEPVVTIVTPSFNQGKFIEETILSILNQTYTNIQYIIVDGGSSDSTMEVVEKYRDNIDIIIHEKDKGQADAINKGFKLAKGELVGWINSDDVLYPECVEKIVELYQEKNDGAIYYCSTLDWIDSSSAFLRTLNVKVPNHNYLLKKRYSLIQQGSFYCNKILKCIDYLDDKNPYCMDLDLWLRLSKHGNIYSLDDKSYSAFRIWEDTKTSNGGKKFLHNIRQVLLNNGASIFSPTVLTTYLYGFKINIKSLFSKR